MNPESQRVRDVFVAAVRLPPNQWDAFLKEACAGDEELRRQVSELLQEHQQAGSFLDRPAVPPPTIGDCDPATDGATHVAIQDGPGTVIGPYKLLQQIGEGGMGVVYMAEQTEPVERRVALKIIKAGMDTRQVVARFEGERHALAMMDHPNIAKVLDAGTTDSGRPYFVMELVKGIPITQYCDEHHLTPRQRLELFVPVCHAVQHAHQKGIIHRDLKPSNVLVAEYDDCAVPKIIDFGVAKAIQQRPTEKSMFTQLGQVVGTIDYMSPEQAKLNQLDIDTRSDIYSLGVLLYELLTGQTPLDGKRLRSAAFDEMLRIIREEEPPRPSLRLSSGESLPSIAANRHTEPKKLSTLVHGELDWIVMKALEKDRSRRYETANGLAADIERYLRDEPVLACPPSAAYRFRKFARKNKGPVAAVSLVVLALVAGIVGTTLGLLQASTAAEAEREARAAETMHRLRAEDAAAAERNARQAEITQRRRAEDNTKLAMAVLDEIFLKEARQRVTLYTREEAKGFAKNPERERLERELLEKGLEFYEQLAQSNAMDWAARRERAKAYANVALLRLDLKDYVESVKTCCQAAQLMEELAKENPQEFDNRFDLANNSLGLYRAYYDSGQFGAAAEACRRGIVLFEKLAADFPDRRPLAQEYRAYCHRNLGDSLLKSAKPADAEQAFQQCLTIWSELAMANPKAAGYRNALAYDYRKLGEVYHQTGQFVKASAAWREAQTLFEKLAAEFPGEPGYQSHVAHLDWSLGGLLKATAKPKEAEESYRRALRRFEKLAADHPATAFYRQEHAYTFWQLAWLMKETGRVQEVEKAYNQALPILEELVIDFPDNAEYRSRLSANLAGLAESLLRQGKHAEAAKVAEKMADDAAKGSNAAESAVLVLIRCMALAEKDTALSEADRKTVAKRYGDRPLELMQKALQGGMDTPVLRELREALPLRTDNPQGQYRLGNVLSKQDAYAEAEVWYRRALAHRPDFPEARAKLGYSLWKQGRNAEAEAECREALRLRPGDAEAYFTLGLTLYWGNKTPVAAVKFFTQAFAAHPKLADDLRFCNRYNAACSAAVAGCGQGEDAAKLDEKERARLRRQALDWLLADLAAWDQLLQKQPEEARPRVQFWLRHWQQDPDFAGVRGDAISRLPEAERQPWQQLWADVEETLKKANQQEAKDTKKEP